MAEEFTSIIASWQPFYNLAGSAAFTLAGLMFVAVTINIGMVAMASEKGDLMQFARQTLGNFLALMIISLIFMIPEQDRLGTGIPLLSVGLIMMWRAAKLWKRFEFEKKEQRVLDSAMFRSELLIPNTLCYALLVFVSATLLSGDTQFLWLMPFVILWLLLAGSLSAWFLMLRLAKQAQEDKASV